MVSEATSGSSSNADILPTTNEGIIVGTAFASKRKANDDGVSEVSGERTDERLKKSKREGFIGKGVDDSAITGGGDENVDVVASVNGYAQSILLHLMS